MKIEPLAKAEIKRWLAALVIRGQARVTREGPTLDAIANYTGIPLQSIRYFARSPDSKMGNSRQMLLSKVIGLIENGYLVFHVEQGTRKKLAVLLDKPIPPKAKAKVVFTREGPRLQLVAPVRMQARLPSFKGLKIGEVSGC